MEKTVKTASELLDEAFLRVFKKVKFTKNLVTVSDGENEQSFCVEAKVLEDLRNVFNKKNADDLVDTIKINFDHIFSDEN